MKKQDEIFVVVEWINSHPVIDGADAFTSKQAAIDFVAAFPNIESKLNAEGIEVRYTICSVILHGNEPSKTSCIIAIPQSNATQVEYIDDYLDRLRGEETDFYK